MPCGSARTRSGPRWLAACAGGRAAAAGGSCPPPASPAGTARSRTAARWPYKREKEKKGGGTQRGDPPGTPGQHWGRAPGPSKMGFLPQNPTHHATPTGFMGFLPFFRVGMYSTPSGRGRGGPGGGPGGLGGGPGGGRWQPRVGGTALDGGSPPWSPLVAAARSPAGMEGVGRGHGGGARGATPAPRRGRGQVKRGRGHANEGVAKPIGGAVKPKGAWSCK